MGLMVFFSCSGKGWVT